MYFVMHVVRPDNADEVFIVGLELDFDSAMNNYIMKNKIGHTIQRNSQTKIQQQPERINLQANNDERSGHNSKNNSKQIIDLKPAFVMYMVRLVPVPHRAVHDILVAEPSKGFHKKKSKNDRQHIYYPHNHISYQHLVQSYSHILISSNQIMVLIVIIFRFISIVQVQNLCNFTDLNITNIKMLIFNQNTAKIEQWKK